MDVGVVLAGGTGSRLLPLTKTVNKHLLSVNGHPMLHWPLRTLAKLGVRLAVVVLGGRSCGEVVEHFGSRYDTGEGVLSLVYVYQERAGGIPDALAQALPMIEATNASRIVVVLGDNVFPGGLPEAFDEAQYQDPRRAIALAKPVPDARSYGCVPIEPDGSAHLARLVEKPEGPPPAGTEWGALLGLYALPTANLAPILAGLRPSARGELEIVDVLVAYASIFALSVAVTSEPWIDAGDPPGYALANSPGFWNATEAQVHAGLRALAKRSSS